MVWSLPSNESAIDAVLEAIAKAGYQPERDLVIALDPAATEFFDARPGITSSKATTER